jgi:hypothetical protein
MSLDLWIGVGDHSGPPQVAGQGNSPARSQARYAGAGVAVVSNQRGGLTVRSSGFGDVDMVLDVDAVTTLSQPKKLPELASAARAHLRLNLLTQTATLTETSFHVGKGTKAELALSVREMLSAPTVSIDTLKGGADLGELSPLINAFVPGVRVSGRVELAAAPMKMAIGSSPAELSSNLSAKAVNLSAAMQGNVVSDLDAGVTLSLASGIAGVSADANIATASAPQGAAKGLHATLELTTPVGPWLGEGDGMFAMVSDMRVGHAEAPNATADAITLHVESTGPIAMLQNKPAGAALQTNVVMGVGSAVAAGSVARDISFSCEVSQRDLMASVADVVMQAGVGAATTTLPQGDMTAPRLAAAMTVKRRGQSIGKRPNWKKAIVQLKEGDTIDFFAAE